MHKDRDQKVAPVLEALGFGDKKDRIKYQVLRVLSRYYISAEKDAYLIPVRIEETAPRAICDSSMNLVNVAVGQRIYFTAPVLVEPGMDFLVITAR